jgi:hypothetical protein
MKTLRALEGELLIDHRNSPGVPGELLIANGLPVEAGRGLYESATYTCNHCQAIVVMNPNRTRERHVCRGCMHVICDGCAAEKARTLQCVTFQQKVDLLLAGK